MSPFDGFDATDARMPDLPHEGIVLAGAPGRGCGR